MWLGDQRARAMVREQPDNWLIRPAGDGRAPAMMLSGMAEDQRAGLFARIEAATVELRRLVRHGALGRAKLRAAGRGGSTGMVPRQVVLRLFLAFDGTRWRAMHGGLARVLQDSDRLAGSLPAGGLSKDVWVLNDERSDIVGPSAVPLGPLPIRRTTGDLPRPRCRRFVLARPLRGTA